MASGLGPDEGGLPSAEELFRTGPDLAPAEVIQETRHLLGLDSARRVRHGEMPGVDGLAEELGLA